MAKNITVKNGVFVHFTALIHYVIYFLVFHGNIIRGCSLSLVIYHRLYSREDYQNILFSLIQALQHLRYEYKL